MKQKKNGIFVLLLLPFQQIKWNSPDELINYYSTEEKSNQRKFCDGNENMI